MLARWRHASTALAAVLSLAIAGSIGIAGAQTEPRSNRDLPADAIAAYENDKALAGQLMQAGKFREAVHAAGRAAAASETLYGADSVETAVALHNHGFLLKRSDQIETARSALERALAIYERQRPAVHEDSRNAAGELGQIYLKAGRATAVASIYARLIARAGAEGDGGHVGVAHLAANQGFLLLGLGKPEESEAAFERAVALYEANGEVTADAYRQVLEALLDRLVGTQREAQAAAKARATIQRLGAMGPPGVPLAVTLHDRLSQTALEAGRHGEARHEAEAALTLIQGAGASLPRSRPGRPDPSVSALNNLARAHRAEANFAGAEDAYRRAIALLEASGDNVNTGVVTDNLAVLYLAQDRHDDAERLHKRALHLLEEALGREHASVGRVAGNLGTLLSEAGRHAEAEPLLRRGLAIARAQPAQDPVSIGILEDNLAGLLRETKRRPEARGHYLRALELFEAALPPKHPRLATTRNNVGCRQDQAGSPRGLRPLGFRAR
jgi:tetratricopeptide (TPR) repeat protein